MYRLLALGPKMPSSARDRRLWRVQATRACKFAGEAPELLGINGGKQRAASHRHRLIGPAHSGERLADDKHGQVHVAVAGEASNEFVCQCPARPDLVVNEPPRISA